MSDYPVKVEELFPYARVPGAQTDREVFAAWEKLGLKPIEVTTPEVTQTISISHNAVTGEITWTAHKLDGVQACGILFAALCDIGEYYFKSKPRPVLSSGKARAFVQLDGNDIQMAAEPANDQPVVRGILVAALLNLLERQGHPLEELGGLMKFEVKD